MNIDELDADLKKLKNTLESSLNSLPRLGAAFERTLTGTFTRGLEDVELLVGQLELARTDLDCGARSMGTQVSNLVTTCICFLSSLVEKAALVRRRQPVADAPRPVNITLTPPTGQPVAASPQTARSRPPIAPRPALRRPATAPAPSPTAADDFLSTLMGSMRNPNPADGPRRRPMEPL